MKRRKLIVCDEDELYARKLYEYISLKGTDVYETVLITGKEILLEYLESNNPEVLLVSGTFKDMDLSGYDIEHVIYLTEDRNATTEKPAIFKYSPANIILSELIGLYTVTEAALFGPKGETKVIGVYTPVKRSFQTTFAITLGQILAKDKKTLYLNFESFSGFDILTGKATKTDLMDLLYLSECNRDTFSFRIGSITEKIGKLEYIPPARVYTAFADITAKQWLSLISLISEQTDYEYLILDLSEQVIGLLDILNNCDRIFTIVDNGRTARAKMAQYQELLSGKALKNIIDNTEKITIPICKEIPQEFEMLAYSELATHIRAILSQEPEL